MLVHPPTPRFRIFPLGHRPRQTFLTPPCGALRRPPELRHSLTSARVRISADWVGIGARRDRVRQESERQEKRCSGSRNAVVWRATLRRSSAAEAPYRWSMWRDRHPASRIRPSFPSSACAARCERRCGATDVDAAPGGQPPRRGGAQWLVGSSSTNGSTSSRRIAATSVGTQCLRGKHSSCVAASP